MLRVLLSSALRPSFGTRCVASPSPLLSYSLSFATISASRQSSRLQKGAKEGSTAAASPTGASHKSSTWVPKKSGTGLDMRIHFFPSGTTDFSVKNAISPWHDIPLHLKQAVMDERGVQVSPAVFAYVNEIPKNTIAKHEVATTEEKNPIKQDTKQGKLRSFTYGKIPFNYGCLPQTWEDPHKAEEESKCKGDNDPLDLVEISPGALPEGAVIPVKVLGVLAMIDDGEMDWKVLAISVANPLADLLHDAGDIERHVPGLEFTIKEWFRNYKTTDGKPKNTFAYKEKVMSTKKALHVIEETHQSWKDLVSGKTARGKLWLPK